MTPYERAQRFVGVVTELPGVQHHPLIQWWLSLCGFGHDAADEVAWCSAFVNGVMWDLRLPRSKSAAARSWLGVGLPLPLADAVPGNDVIILTRGTGTQPGADVVNAPGHVGLYAGREGDRLLVLGGNQNNTVSIAPYHASRLLGVRRIT